MKIEVGDRVTSNDPTVAGLIGKVLRFDNDYPSELVVEFEGHSQRLYTPNGRRDVACGYDQLAVVEVPLFKVGDRVKSSDPSLGIGTVREYTFSRVGYTVDYPSYRGASYVADGTRFKDFGTDKITLYEGDKKEGEVKMGVVMGEPAERVSKHKAGDKVRVRRDLYVGRFGPDSVVGEMLLMAGEVVTIKRIVTEGRYSIEETSWNWTDEMFEETPAETTLIYVRFGHDTKKFLFTAPSKTALTDGTKVYVKTKRSDRSVATCVGDTFKVDDTALKNICKGADITLGDLQPIIGLAIEKKTYDFKPL